MIESVSDSSAGRREVSSNLTTEVLTLVPTPDSALSFTLVVDTFTTTTQTPSGPAPVIQLPVQVTGLLAGKTVMISTDTGTKCHPVSSALVADLHNLLTPLATELAKGMAWRDSVDTDGCQAGIPTTSRTISSYLVSGEADFEGGSVLLVQRSDTIRAHGEGAQQQHLLKLDASGTGNAVYYLDVKQGRVIRITTGQELSLTVTTVSGSHQFRQSSRQEFRIAP